MKKLFPFSYYTFFILLFLCSCTEDSTILGDTEKREYQFSAKVANKASTQNYTRNSDYSWEASDSIGVFMLKRGAKEIQNNIIDDIENIPIISYNGFTWESNKTIYCKKNTLVNFVAYYPFATLNADYTYNIKLENQDTPHQFDLLYSDNAKDISCYNVNVELNFKHMLCKITVNVIEGTGFMKAAEGVGLSFSGFANTALFDLNRATIQNIGDFEVIKPRQIMTAMGVDATFEAILIPTNNNEARNREINILLHDGRKYTYIISPTDKFESGKRYKYNIILNNSDFNIERKKTYDWNVKIPYERG